MKGLQLLAICLISGFLSFAQNTPEDLGKEVFNAFQNKDLEMLNALFPKPEEMLSETRKQGIEFTPEQELDFISNFPQQINRYKLQCNVMIGTELGRKVDWENSMFHSSEKFVRQIPVATDTSKTLDATDVNIHFKDNNGEYTLTLSQCLELNGRWFLGGGQVLLSPRQIQK